MSHVTILWSAVATGALLLAIMYGAVWALDRKAYAYLAFAFEALAIVGIVIFELGMMYSTTAAEWGEWLRWFQIPIFLRTVALLAFIRFYFKTGRSWLMWTIITSRAIILIAGFVSDPNFNFASIDSIDRVAFLGEQVTIVGQAVVSPYQWVATASTILVLTFVGDASFTLWRRGTYEARRKVIVIGGAVFLSLAIGIVLTQLMIYGNVHVPALLSPPSMIVLAAMTFELGRDALRTRQKVEELQRELAHAGRVSALGTLSSSLTHELSQPMSAILINTRLGAQLLKGPNPDLEELRQILDDIRRDNQRAIEVIDHLRSLLKRRSLDFTPVSVERLLEDTSALLKSDAIARNVRLECASDAGTGMVHGDVVHLSQVLINLIINAMDAVADLPDGRRHVSVRACTIDGSWVELAISDSGRGIPPDSLGRIFEPFYTTKAAGMGMGLSISRIIVEAHAGRIWAENGGYGTTLRVQLPLAE
ncbi:MAG TPA: ATP-binding protein [Woeseiaceae bacterium]|nr:ATP-binding protein [Woeseiaceae bacterium]